MTSDEVLGLETKVSKREQLDADCEIDIGKQNESQLGKCTHYEQLGREANKKYADDRNQSVEENMQEILWDLENNYLKKCLYGNKQNEKEF